MWHANASTGRCDPGQARLRNETGFSRRAIQYALQELETENIVSRRLRGSASTAYQVNWQRLSDLVEAYEARSKSGDVTVTPAERDMRGRKSVHQRGAKDCALGAQEHAPKPTERNSGSELMFPVGTFPDTGKGAVPDETAARKLLGIKEDHAFLAALDRAVQRGQRFSASDAELFYSRLEAIHSALDHSHGDPVAGRAYRLLETELIR